MIRILLLAAVLLTQETPPAPAPSPTPVPPAPPPKAVYVALLGGTVNTVTQGILKGATLLIKDGKIHRIGNDVELPDDTTKIDVAGKMVFPGFVAATARGLGTSGSSRKMADALDPYQENVKLALAAGITSAYIEAAGGMFGGRTEGITSTSAVIKMTYGDLDSMLLVEPAAINLTSWMSASATQRQEMRDNFKKGREFIEKAKDFESRRTAGKTTPGEQPPQSGALDPYVRLMRGEIPARIQASSADEIATALSLVTEFRFDAVLLDVEEAWTMADEIGRARCSCLVTPRRKRPENKRSGRPSGSSIEQAAILHKAGVKFAVVPLQEAIDTGGIAGRDLQSLPIEAAFAVRGGLDPATAIRSVTINAAEALGVANRVGSLEEGKDADIIVLDGDPLDYKTFVEKTFVNGKLLYDKATSPYFEHLKRAR